jgi:hypothetical protein
MSYIDQRDAAIVAIQALIGPNGTGAITGQVHQDNEVGQTNDAYLNLVGYDNFAYVIVRTGINVATGAEDDTFARNGTNLVLAYAAASALTPGGAALGPNNRVAVLIPPGTYSLAGSFLNLDTQYVDLIGLGAAEDTIITSVFNGPTGEGTITKNVDDVVIKNVTLKNDAIYAAGPALASVPSAYAPQGGYGNELLENVIFKADVTKNPFMRQDQNYAGTYRNCRAIGPTPGVPVWTMFAGCSGAFENCSTTDNGFGYYDGSGLNVFPLSGTFKNCQCDSGFGVDTLGTGTFTMTGSYTDCVAVANGFGVNYNTMAGTYLRCRAGNAAALCITISGTYTDCYFGAGNGFAGSNCSATVTNCSSGPGSFSFSVANTGVFQNCIGADASFIGAGGSFNQCTGGTASFLSDSGTYVNCRAGGSSFGGGANTAVYFGCSAGGDSFNAITMGGSYTLCDASDGSFGSQAGGTAVTAITGSFFGCKAGNFSFGHKAAGPDQITMTGAQFQSCSAGTQSFGSNVTMDADTWFVNCVSGSSSFGTATLASYTIQALFSSCTAGDTSFGYSSGSGNPITLTGARFTHCTAGNLSFGTSCSTDAATEFSFCKGGDFCFAYGNGGAGQSIAGHFCSCEAGSTSFASGVQGPRGTGPGAAITAEFRNCHGGDNCFGAGAGVTLSGLVSDCSAGNWSFGTSQANATGQWAEASGSFYNCTGGDNCFGASSGTFGGAVASGRFYRCQAGDGSFGSNNATSSATTCYASGYFESCIGEYRSFAGHNGALKTGTFLRCTLLNATDDYGPLVENGIMEECVWAIRTAAEPALRVANLVSPIVAPNEAPKVYGGRYIAGVGAAASIAVTNVATATPAAVILQIRANVAIAGAIVNDATAGALDAEGNYVYSGL